MCGFFSHLFSFNILFVALQAASSRRCQLCCQISHWTLHSHLIVSHSHCRDDPPGPRHDHEWSIHVHGTLAHIYRSWFIVRRTMRSVKRTIFYGARGDETTSSRSHRSSARGDKQSTCLFASDIDDDFVFATSSHAVPFVFIVRNHIAALTPTTTSKVQNLSAKVNNCYTTRGHKRTAYTQPKSKIFVFTNDKEKKIIIIKWKPTPIEWNRSASRVTTSLRMANSNFQTLQFD